MMTSMLALQFLPSQIRLLVEMEGTVQGGLSGIDTGSGVSVFMEKSDYMHSCFNNIPSSNIIYGGKTLSSVM